MLKRSVIIGCTSCLLVAGTGGTLSPKVVADLVARSKKVSPAPTIMMSKKVNSTPTMMVARAIDDEPPVDDLLPPTIDIQYTVIRNTYDYKCNVSGSVASNFTPTGQVYTAEISGLPFSVPIYDWSGNGLVPAGWTLQATSKWTFNTVPQGTYGRIKFVYHHGYNTTSEWFSGVDFGSGALSLGRILNHFGPKDVNNGGNFNCPAGIIDIGSMRAGGTYVMYKQNNNVIGCGKCELRSVEFQVVSPQTTTYVNIPLAFSVDAAHAPEKINMGVPGIDLLVNENDMIGLPTVTNLSVTPKTTEETYVVTLTRDEYRAYNATESQIRDQLQRSQSVIAPVSGPGSQAYETSRTAVPVKAAGTVTIQFVQ